MNYARDTEIRREHTFMITKEHLCTAVHCFQSFLCAKHFFFLTKVIFIQGAFKNNQGLLWKIRGLFKDIQQFFNFQGLFKACANHGVGKEVERQTNHSAQSQAW